jgi:hypothetical protein
MNDLTREDVVVLLEAMELWRSTCNCNPIAFIEENGFNLESMKAAKNDYDRKHNTEVAHRRDRSTEICFKLLKLRDAKEVDDVISGIQKEKGK